jgi:hypothetical protein
LTFLKGRRFLLFCEIFHQEVKVWTFPNVLIIIRRPYFIITLRHRQIMDIWGHCAQIFHFCCLLTPRGHFHFSHICWRYGFTIGYNLSPFINFNVISAFLNSLKKYKRLRLRQITFKIQEIQGDHEGVFKLVILNFICKWYNWSNFRNLRLNIMRRIIRKWHLTFQTKLNILFENLKERVNLCLHRANWGALPAFPLINF